MGLKRRRCSHGPTCAPKVVAELTPPRGGLEGVCVKGASRLPCAYLGSLNLFKQDCIYIFLV